MSAVEQVGDMMKEAVAITRTHIRTLGRNPAQIQGENAWRFFEAADALEALYRVIDATYEGKG